MPVANEGDEIGRLATTINGLIARMEAERMRNLVEALLALTRGDDGAPLEIGRHDLGEVVAEAVEAARGATDGKVSVEYVPPDREIGAAFDRGRVRQAASILLDNAVKYTLEGGSVEVRAGESDGRIALSVSDTGVGITEGDLPLIFERFHRADTAPPSVRASGSP